MILGIEHDRAGFPKWITFLERPGAPVRKVRLDLVREVAEGRVRLAGPREGYHITRLYADDLPMRSGGDGGGRGDGPFETAR